MIKVIIIIISITCYLAQQDDNGKFETTNNSETNKLQDEQQNETNETNVEQQNIRKFIKWLFKYGAEVSGVAIDYTQSDNRIIVATEFIKSGSRILFIPHKLLITLNMVKENLLFQELVKNENKMKSPLNTYLGLQILYEKYNPFSPFKPYLDILPQNYNTFPIFFNETELQCFKGSPFLQEIEKLKRELKHEYNVVLKFVPEFSIISYDEFVWARTTSSSRIFSLNINGVITEAFVPLADLFNHDSEYQGRWSYSDEEQGYYVDSIEDIDEGMNIMQLEKGAEIFVSYGNKNNHRLLLYYGFIQPENEVKTCYFDVEISKDYPLIYVKQSTIQAWYKKNVGQIVRFGLTDDLSEQTNMNFINLIRFLQEEDLEIIQKYEKEDSIVHSLKNEIKLWNFIKQQTQKQLESYEINDDYMNKFMNDQELDINIENCLIVLLEEQEIYNFYLQMANKTIQFIDNKEYLNQNLIEQYKEAYTVYFEHLSHLLDHPNDDL